MILERQETYEVIPNLTLVFLPGELFEAPAEITRTQRAVVPLGKERSERYLGLLK